MDPQEGQETTGPIDVTIIGGGMITRDLLLPSVYHLARTGSVGQIRVCALTSGPLKSLKEDREICEAFPDQDFSPFPDVMEGPDRIFPELYRDVLAGMPAGLVIVAAPDPLHHEMVMAALHHNLHVLCVKPLVLKYSHAGEIEKVARTKGLYVGVEYHKRFDRRSLIAKKDYALGKFGEFVIGEAKMIEPYGYRFSNFRNWFFCDRTDPFVYVGCHYVDLVCFITGLKPVEVSVAGVRGTFPNGKEGYMWANGRVRFENGALLSVTTGLGYPDEGAGSNEQCLSLFCEGDGRSGIIKHDDQFRGVAHGYVSGTEPGMKRFQFVNPDFFRLIPWEGQGFRPCGYGFDSVAAHVHAARAVEAAGQGPDVKHALKKRRSLLNEIDEKGLLATPANSFTNELVHEAARISILKEGHPVRISYGKTPGVEIRK